MVARLQGGPLWSIDQYLALERYSPIKHEFHGGYVYAMAGGTQAHSQIAVNVVSFLRTAVRASDCRVLNSDIKVRQSQDDFVYTDAVVTCDPQDRAAGQDWIDYPVLIVEVLSPSTEKHDRGDKFEGYKALPSLREYVLIDYRRRAVEVWRRDDAGHWFSTMYGQGQDIVLQTVGPALSLDVVYEDSGL